MNACMSLGHVCTCACMHVWAFGIAASSCGLFLGAIFGPGGTAAFPFPFPFPLFPFMIPFPLVVLSFKPDLIATGFGGAGGHHCSGTTDGLGGGVGTAVFGAGGSAGGRTFGCGGRSSRTGWSTWGDQTDATAFASAGAGASGLGGGEFASAAAGFGTYGTLAGLIWTFGVAANSFGGEGAGAAVDLSLFAEALPPPSFSRNSGIHSGRSGSGSHSGRWGVLQTSHTGVHKTLFLSPLFSPIYPAASLQKFCHDIWQKSLKQSNVHDPHEVHVLRHQWAWRAWKQSCMKACMHACGTYHMTYEKR